MIPPNQRPPPLLRVEGLALTRGGRLLFEAVGFHLSNGEMMLVRGPNGAGKSSLLLVVAGLLRPDSGLIEWLGGEPPGMHLFGHAPGIKPRLTLGENLGFWRDLYGPTGVAPKIALATVGLGGLDGIEAGHLSAGQLRRLGLARLLVSKRPVWILDEPVASLDAEGEKLVSELLKAHLSAGGAAIVATHHDIPIYFYSQPTLWMTLRLGPKP
jgi:heme exporter protein A